MTIMEAMLSAARLPVLGVLFLLLTIQMAVAIAAFREGRSRRARYALLAAFFLSMAGFCLCMAVISCRYNYPGWAQEPPAWLAAVFACPVWAVWAYEAVTAVILFFAIRNTLRYRADHITPDSVKQAMDLLPIGIAFGEPDGSVRFRNLVMDHLAGTLTGKLLTDWRVFESEGAGQVSVKDRIWQIDRRETPGRSLMQLTATDITKQARILADLEAKNRKLKDIRLRLELYNRQAERIIIAQELLTARMTVHDELGSVLLESRHYLRDPSSIDEDLLLQALKNANTYLLHEYERDDTAVDPLAEALSMARAIGVKVTLTGIPPTQESPRGILAAAIRECASNAVKHAEGDRLTADARRSDTGHTFTLCSNGRLPAMPIRETGGLLSLRTLAESRHGIMRIDVSPLFRLTIQLPLSDESMVPQPNRRDSP